MARQHQQNKLSQTNRGEVVLEQNVAIDDSLLPAASELERLKSVDPNIIPWIMQRTEIEQNARISHNKAILNLNEIDLKRTHRFNMLALILGFLLFVAVISLSAYFIFANLPVQGTIFGGTAILLCVVYFSRAIHNSKEKK